MLNADVNIYNYQEHFNWLNWTIGYGLTAARAPTTGTTTACTATSMFPYEER